MAGNERHDWTEETEEGMRIYKAVYFAKEWRFATSMKGSRRAPADWRDIHDVTPELWQKLRDILFKKYQRKRCPWKFIEDIDKKLGREVDNIKKNRGK